MFVSLRSAKRRAAVGRRIHFLVLAVLGTWLPTGCKSLHLPEVHLPRTAAAAAYSPRNHVNAGAIPAAVRRVAVLPLHAEAWRSDEVAGLDEALCSELARMERFEIVRVSRAELRARFDRETFASSSALPADFLTRLRTDFGADAVLLLDLSHYAPYQPLAVGVRAKLVTADEGEALWSFDALFDSAQAEVATAARRFSAGKSRPATASEDNTGVLQSPSRFAKYVGHAVFTTLPPRQTE